MPISTTALEQEFSALSTEEVVADKPSPSFVTPKKARDANSSILSDDETCASDSFPVAPSPSTPDSVETAITKTDHKLMEERGELEPEPLLVSNPHRFVIFPIRDNDVSPVKLFSNLTKPNACIALLLPINLTHVLY